MARTRLALRIATEIEEQFADGVAWVPLAAVDDAADVAATIAMAVGVSSSSPERLFDAIGFGLADARLLLVLDNFEHVAAAAAEVASLLSRAPEVKALVTSRTLLRVSGEHALPIPPLGLPAPGELSSFLESAQSDAVRLFAVRARAVFPSFQLTELSAPIVVDICRRLDGIPLAIELAAVRVAHLPLAILGERLEHRLPLLVGGPRDLPARLRTMRTAIAWSYDLLSGHEQALFRRLAVFVDGFRLESAEAVAGPEERPAAALPSSQSPPTVLDLLGSLVSQSVVQYEPEGSFEPRYRLLETLREFAADLLAESGQAAAAGGAHAAHFIEFAERHELDVYGPIDHERIVRLEAEAGNLRAAMTWLEANDAKGFVRLVASLGWSWWIRGDALDGWIWLSRARAKAAAGVGTGAKAARIVAALGYVAFLRGDNSVSEECFRESLERYRALGDALGEVLALGGLCAALYLRGDDARAVDIAAQSLALARSLPDPRLAALASADALNNLSAATRGLGQPALAMEYIEEALALQRRFGDVFGEMHSLLDLGIATLEAGDARTAVEHFRQGLQLTLGFTQRRVTLGGLTGVALAMARLGDPHLAVRLLGAVERSRELTGVAGQQPLENELTEHTLSALRSALGEPAFTEAWRAGRAMSTEQAVAEALRSEPIPPRPHESTLTRRELDVLRLLAAGLTDRAIGDELFIGTRTVEGHVARIFEKLGVRTRAGAVTAAFATGLIEPSGPPSLP